CSAVEALHRVGGELLHTSQVTVDLVGGGVRARDAGGDADAVVGRAAHGEPGQARQVLADAGHAGVVADGVLGQTVLPARDAGGDRGGGQTGGLLQVLPGDLHEPGVVAA